MYTPIDPPAELLTLLAHPTVPAGIKQAMARASGARFYRCALQVNPYEYLARHNKSDAFGSEQAYNDAMVAACRAAGVEVVSVTDHFRISGSASLMSALESAGIIVFPGFEANSSEGIHLLCLFAPGTAVDKIERHIGACDLSEPSTAPSPQSKYSCEQLIEVINEKGGLVIAAHVSSASGLLTTLSGNARARVWKSSNLMAAALPGAPNEGPQAHIAILSNKDEATKRERPLCIINASDVSDPAGFADPRSSTQIKMTDVSIEGLRQGFLDWESRVRLASDEPDGEHTEVYAISWTGGLFDGQCLRLNSGLNVLVGGRGAGKSTLIESVRFALDQLPKGDEANRAHQSILRGVLGTGTTVSVLVRSPKPSPKFYLIERIMGQRPVVRDQTATILPNVSPSEVIGTFEIFGQHEISELTRQPAKLAEILRRFTGPEVDGAEDRARIKSQLQVSRQSILSEVGAIEDLENDLATLPALQVSLGRFASAGLEARLADKTNIDAEGRLFDALEDQSGDLAHLADALAIDDPTAEPLLDAASKLPNRDMLLPINGINDQAARAKARAAAYLHAVSRRMRADAATLRANWEPMRAAAEAQYLNTVKELEAEGHDPKKFIAIQGQVEALKPKEAQKAARVVKKTDLESARASLLIEWEAFKAKDFVELNRAAAKVSKRLKDKVRVRVQAGKNLGELEALLRAATAGQISQPLERLKLQDDLSLSQLGENIRSGPAALMKAYGFTQSGAEKIAEGGLELSLKVEECQINAEAVVELNVSPKDGQNWKSLDDLSTGQKATAVLLLLLLESEAPLIVDQPEDDLDNRFIADSIVPAMRIEKHGRQFVFSSHNANIPVLGDAEQIVGLTPVVDGGAERTLIYENQCGSIDVSEIKDLVRDFLEGGQKAFTTRRDKYGF